MPFVAALVTLITLSLPHAQAAQTPPAPGPPPEATAMKRLDFLAGRWEGTGWIQRGPERATFRQQETIRYAAGNTVMVIDGLGHSTDAGKEGRVVHEAFAIVSYDAAQQTFRWRAYRADGHEIDTTADVSTDKLVWGFEAGPGAKIRFTITKTPAGEWLEIGEMTQASGQTFKFFEMTLHRTGDAH